MTLLAILLMTVIISGALGTAIGHGIAQSRTADALKLRRYETAITVLRDVPLTPDTFHLYERAAKIVRDHDVATEPERKAN